MKSIKFRVWNTKEKRYHLPFKNCSTTFNLEYYEITKHVSYPEQYIGLEDSEGTEIYEGDILETKWPEDPGTCSVYYDDGSYRLKYTNCEWREDVPYPILNKPLIFLMGYRVVGNIHEKDGDK